MTESFSASRLAPRVCGSGKRKIWISIVEDACEEEPESQVKVTSKLEHSAGLLWLNFEGRVRRGLKSM